MKPRSHQADLFVLDLDVRARRESAASHDFEVGGEWERQYSSARRQTQRSWIWAADDASIIDVVGKQRRAAGIDRSKTGAVKVDRGSRRWSVLRVKPDAAKIRADDASQYQDHFRMAMALSKQTQLTDEQGRCFRS